MDKLQISYFLTVAESLNISKSAETLMISQSSLSQTLGRLEKELGYPLFDRKGKRLILNENGEIFQKYAIKMKNLYEDSLSELAETNNQANKNIRINIRCASYHLPQLLLYLRTQLPDTSFFITQNNSGRAKDEPSDLTITASSTPLRDENSFPLLQEEILLAIPWDNQLVSKPSIGKEDLLHAPFISLGANWSLEQTIREACEKIDFHPSTTISVDNPDVMRRLLTEQMGFAFLPAKTWGSDFAKGNIVLRSMEDFSAKRYLYVLSSNGYLRPAVRKCVQCIQEFFGSL